MAKNRTNFCFVRFQHKWRWMLFDFRFLYQKIAQCNKKTAINIEMNVFFEDLNEWSGEKEKLFVVWNFWWFEVVWMHFFESGVKSGEFVWVNPIRKMFQTAQEKMRKFWLKFDRKNQRIKSHGLKKLSKAIQLFEINIEICMVFWKK